MSRRFRSISVRRYVLLAAASLAFLCGPAVSRARSADALKDSTSLKFVPADVAFYSASLRMKEQFDAFLKSKAYAALKEMPAYKMAMGLIRAQLAKPPFSTELGKPENKELIKLLGEMVSQEVFCYGDARFAELAELAALVQNAGNFGQLQDLLESRQRDPFANAWHMIKLLDRHRAKLRTPNIFIGFKVATPRRANAQLARLKALIEAKLAAQPELKKRFKQVRVGGSNYLTLELDGSLVPWDIVPIAAFERKAGEFDKLIAHLKTVKLTLSLGVRDNYLLLAMSESSAFLKSTASAKLLYDRAEFAPLRKHAAKPITGISYVSRALARSTGTGQGQIAELLEFGRKAFDKTKVSEKVKREFEADLKKLRAQLKGESTAGAKMAFTFRNSRGFEGFTYDWSENESLDSSKKLSLLSHVGGNPIAFVVARGKHNPEGYKKFADVMKRVFYYGEQAALAQMKGAQRAQYHRVRDKLLPLIGRLHKANTDYLDPALKDGQGGFVLDAKIRSKQWFPFMPPAKVPLPMFEIGLVFGVSDAAKLKKGCREYFAVAQKVYDGMREVFPDKLPAFQIPAPTETKVAAGTTWHYGQLKLHGVDEQIAPTAGLSKNVAVLSTSRKLAERVLASNPFSPPPGLLTDRNRVLASASYFNSPALVDAIAGWVDYGFQKYLQFQAAQVPNEVSLQDDAKAKAILAQIHTGLRILKCFRGSSSATWREGKVWITHSESVWKDLEK